jgi:hypothetical protein
MESVFGFRFDGNNAKEPLQLGIWNRKNNSEQRDGEGKFMTYLKFAILSYYLLTDTNYLAQFQPNITSLQATYGPLYQYIQPLL